MPAGFRAGATWRPASRRPAAWTWACWHDRRRPAKRGGDVHDQPGPRRAGRLSRPTCPRRRPPARVHWGGGGGALDQRLRQRRDRRRASATSERSPQPGRRAGCTDRADAGHLDRPDRHAVAGRSHCAAARQLASDGLAATDEALAALAEQMCTTDTRPKAASVTLELPDPTAQPRPVTCQRHRQGRGHDPSAHGDDAGAGPDRRHRRARRAHGLLLPAVEQTWNQLTVDGDTSTNDTVFLLASGAAGRRRWSRARGARQLVGRSWPSPVARAPAGSRRRGRDHADHLPGQRRRTIVEARAVARSVVASSLVKAAVHGRDPNWGRIVAAAGNALVTAGR
jgi:hypothetical protein